MTMIRGLIFDFDGLVLETEIPRLQSWQEIYGDHNQELTFEVWKTTIGAGPSAFDPILHLEELTGQTVNREQLQDRSDLRTYELLKHASLQPGVEDYMTQARRMGMKVGIASSSPRFWVVDNVVQHKIMDRLDCICTREDVENTKPSPDLYLLALEKLQLQPNEAIAFEDSPNGIRAAQAAGIFCVAIPNPITRMLDTSFADLSLESLADVSLSGLLENIQNGHLHL